MKVHELADRLQLRGADLFKHGVLMKVHELTDRPQCWQRHLRRGVTLVKLNTASDIVEVRERDDTAEVR